MSKKHCGLILKNIIGEKNLSVKQVADLSGRTRQQLHNDFNRVKLRDDLLTVYSNALSISKQTFYDRMEEIEPNNNIDSSNYLMEHLASLEEQFKRLLNQLETKDNQIQSLTEMLKMTLGKPDLSELDTCIVLDLISYQMSA